MPEIEVPTAQAVLYIRMTREEHARCKAAAHRDQKSLQEWAKGMVMEFVGVSENNEEAASGPGGGQ